MSRSRLRQPSPDPSTTAGAWCALTCDSKQWIQVDLQRLHLITGVVLQGREDAAQWVTAYRLFGSITGTDWFEITGHHGDGVFPGCSDQVRENLNNNFNAFEARFVRVNPIEWINRELPGHLC